METLRMLFYKLVSLGKFGKTEADYQRFLKTVKH